MNILITLIVIMGASLMVINIVRYFLFIKSTHDVLSAGSRRDYNWKSLAGLLLILILAGYLFYAFVGEPGIVAALLLMGGSIFVAIVLTLMFNLLETAKSRSIEIAQLLVGVIDARDPNLKGHSQHVQRITMLFYSYLPASIKRAINPVSLEYAALMHDVGKLGVPEAILNKPAKLEDDEWIVMKRHPNVGVKILRPVKTFDDINDWIMYHHERIDGKGYHYLSAKDIPLPSKIIAIADTYSAITMRRSYKEPQSHENAIRIITEVAGTQLDANLVKIFMSIPKEELIECHPEFIDIAQ